ncbi:ATP-binding protein [Achromobacter xylosoxidans]|uniref:ATP-binding protein n=1 Tax=Alcaligenes xylosoxydans xylosoxydans TaxID=85698 RepID=UPI001F5E54DE|nr:ATP-binding protein [Achromobacter xylosoxidans]
MKEQQEREASEAHAKWLVELRQRRANELLGRAAIPPRFADRTLANFMPHADGPAKALVIAREFAENFAECQRTGQGLVFCGGVGAGKTHLAVGICHEVIKQDRVAVFSSVLSAVRSIKETYRKGSELTEAEAIQNLVDPDLLVLDEVGVQFGSETEKMYLFEVINGRYQALKPTIVISNLAKDPLTEYLGERVIDRLREGGGRMVVFDWPSYRRQA